MTLPTREDIVYAIHVMKRTAATDMDKVHAIGERMKALLPLYDEGMGGLSIKEVDLYLHAIVDGEKMGSQIHTFTVDGEYELLPQDEEDKIPTTIWNIREIRAHIGKEECPSIPAA